MKAIEDALEHLRACEEDKTLHEALGHALAWRQVRDTAGQKEKAEQNVAALRGEHTAGTQDKLAEAQAALDAHQAESKDEVRACCHIMKPSCIILTFCLISTYAAYVIGCREKRWTRSHTSWSGWERSSGPSRGSIPPQRPPPPAPPQRSPASQSSSASSKAANRCAHDTAKRFFGIPMLFRWFTVAKSF